MRGQQVTAIALETNNKYQVLLDGAPCTRPPAAFVGSNGLLFLTDAADGFVYATPQGTGDVTLSVQVGSRSGSADFHITAAPPPPPPTPIVITVGPPIPLS